MLKKKPPKKVDVLVHGEGASTHLAISQKIRMRIGPGIKVEFWESSAPFAAQNVFVSVTPQFLAEAILTACGVSGHPAEWFQLTYADELARICQTHGNQ